MLKKVKKANRTAKSGAPKKSAPKRRKRKVAAKRRRVRS